MAKSPSLDRPSRPPGRCRLHQPRQDRLVAGRHACRRRRRGPRPRRRPHGPGRRLHGPDRRRLRRRPGNAQGGIGGALSDLVDGFTGRGRGDVARSWIETGPNRQTSPAEVEEAIGSDVVDQLVEKTGLPRGELLDRLSSVLPAAVDGLTPDGRLPPTGAEPRFASA